MNIHPLIDRWIVLTSEGAPKLLSERATEEESTKAYVFWFNSLGTEDLTTWNELEEKGWRCIKVNITITEVQ